MRDSVWTPVTGQLKLFYKSRSLLSGFLITNKYLILILLLFTLISLIFHKYIVYFKDINIYENYSVLILIYLVLIYFTYIKFNLMIRTIYLVKSISFFYNSIKQKKIKDIKGIAFYYYFFNLLIFIISIIFVNKIHYNFVYINISYFIDYTNIISILFVLFCLDNIFTTEFNIVENNNFKPLMVIYYILIIFIPVLLFNCFYDQIITIFRKFFIDNFVVHCDSKGDMNFRDKLIDKDSLVIGHSSNRVIRDTQSSNVYINTASVESSIASSSRVKIEDSYNNYHLAPIRLEKIHELSHINKTVLNKFIVDYFKYPYIVFDDDYYTKAMEKQNVLFEIDPSLLKNLNQYADIFHVHNIPGRFFIDFVSNLNICEMDYKTKHLAINSEYVIKKSQLELLRQSQEDIITKALEEYNLFRDHEYPEKYAEIKSKFERNSQDLESEKETNFYKEISRFKKSASKLRKYLKKLTSDNSSSDDEELFYTSKKSNNSTTTIDSVDSDETIKPFKRDED